MLPDRPEGRGGHSGHCLRRAARRAQTSSALVVDGSQVSCRRSPHPRSRTARLACPLRRTDQAVEVEQAVQVVGLVLQAPGEQPGALQLHGVAVQVGAGDAGPVRAAGGELLARYGQAPLVVVLAGAAGGPGAHLQPWVEHAAAVHHALVVRAVVDEQPQRHPDLVGGQADTVGRGHGVEHVLHQVADLRRHLADRLGRLVQHAVPHDRDVPNDHCHPSSSTVPPLRRVNPIHGGTPRPPPASPRFGSCWSAFPPRRGRASAGSP